VSPLLLAALLAAAPGGASAPLKEETFALAEPGEAVAALAVRCGRCAWGERGREAAVLRLDLDGRYSQHLVLARGSGEHRVALGRVPPGSHTVRVTLDRAASASGARDVAVDSVAVSAVPAPGPEHEGVAHAPILHLRPSTLKAFTDLPLLVWYERDVLPGGGRRLRYSVVFSNEDGGTPPDRLMATWGRVTDIEYVYGVELDAAGRVVRQEYQGEDHALLEFAGRHEGAHPLLWVTTDNNMLASRGAATMRVAPMPVPFDLAGVSREALMDAHPWTYQVSAAEVRREGRVRRGAPPGSRRIPDPRRFAYVEACADMKDAALAFAVGVRGRGGTRWLWSDGGSLAWRIARNPDHFPNGCFRGAVALPDGAGAGDVAGLRFRSYARPRRDDEPPPPPEAGTARLLAVNRLFLLREDDTPGPSLLSWTGERALAPGGEAVELSVPVGSLER
jgi:hypothetical protein